MPSNFGAEEKIGGKIAQRSSSQKPQGFKFEHKCLRKRTLSCMVENAWALGTIIASSSNTGHHETYLSLKWSETRPGGEVKKSEIAAGVEHPSKKREGKPG